MVVVAVGWWCAWMVRVFSFSFFSFIGVRMVGDEGVRGGCCWRGRCSMVAAIAGVAVGGRLVVGWPVGGEERGLECEEVFLLISFPLFIYFSFFLNRGNLLS